MRPRLTRMRLVFAGRGRRTGAFAFRALLRYTS